MRVEEIFIIITKLVQSVLVAYSSYVFVHAKMPRVLLPKVISPCANNGQLDNAIPLCTAILVES